MEERLFWMNRNYHGLDEIGYLLSESQLEGETNGEIKASDFDNNHKEIWGDYAANDTYCITELHNLKEVKAHLTWSDFDFIESHATSNLDIEYPEYIPEELKLTRYVWTPTGYTSFMLPTQHTLRNSTIDKYSTLLGLSQDDLRYNYSDEEYVAIYISQELYKDTLNEKVYLDILNDFNLNGKMERFIKELKEFVDKNHEDIEY